MTVVHFGQLNDQGSPTAFSPTVSSGSGSITSYSATGEYVKIGKRVTASITVNMTNNGTGSGYLKVSGLPFASDTFENVGVGINAISAKQLVCYMSPGTTDIFVRLYDSTYPATSGDVLYVTMTYLSST